MLAAWLTIPRDKRRVWIGVAGVIAVGTVVKVIYFKFSRQIMVDDSTRKHREGLEHLKKAKEFAEWSRKDREKRLPPLTQEQASQMKQYLQMVEEHGISKISEGACEGCPVISAREGERLEVYRTSEAKTRGSFEHKHANES